MPLTTLPTAPAEIRRELDATYSRITHFVEPDATYVRLARAADAMADLAPADSLVMRAQLAAVAGDIPAIRSAVAALAGVPHRAADRLAASAALARLGLWRDAQLALAPLLRSDAAALGRARAQAYAVGLFQRTARESERAEALGHDPGPDDDASSHGRLAARILRNADIPDARVLAHLDVIGSVLRQHRRLNEGNVVTAMEAHPYGMNAVMLEVRVRAGLRSGSLLSDDMYEAYDRHGLPTHACLAVWISCQLPGLS